MSHGISEELRSNGVAWTYDSTRPGNRPAPKTHQRLHFPSCSGTACAGHNPCSFSDDNRGPPMSMTLQHERDNVYRIDIRGTLNKKDLDRCQEALASEMARIGSVKLLFVLAGFEGWEPDAAWNDLTFYVKHGDTIERMAIVGEERWRGGALIFAGADLRKAPVEFFAPEAVAAARAWLATGSSAAEPRP